MKVSVLTTGLALCALAPSALASPLDARDGKTKTVTKTTTETEVLTRWRTRTSTETETMIRTKTKTISKPTTIFKTVQKTATLTKSKTIVGPTTTTTTTIKGPATTITKLGPGTISTVQTSIYVTIPGPSSTSISTKTVQVQPITSTLTKSIAGPTVTSVSTVQGPRTTMWSTLQGSTVYSFVPGPTVTAPGSAVTITAPGPTNTITSWLSSACGPSSSGYMSNSTTTSTSVPSSSTQNATASAVPTQAYVNVITTKCDNPQAYYVQVGGSGTEMDGTVLLGNSAAKNQWMAVVPPTTSTSDGSPQPFIYNSTTGQLQNYYRADEYLTAFDGQDARYGLLGTLENVYGVALTCTLASDSTLDCGATISGVSHSGIQVTGSHEVYLSGMYYAADSSEVNTAVFSLIGACDIGSTGSTDSSTSSSAASSVLSYSSGAAASSTAIASGSSTSSTADLTVAATTSGAAASSTSIPDGWASSTAASASATPTAAQSYTNVIATTCDNPKAYYIKLSSSGTIYDGTVVVGNDWALFDQPENSNTSNTTPVPYTLDPSTGQMQNYFYPDQILHVYVTSDPRNGMIFTSSVNPYYYPPLICSADADGVLSCGADWDGSQREGVFVDDQGHIVINGGTETGTASAHNGTLTMIPACNI